MSSQYPNGSVICGYFPTAVTYCCFQQTKPEVRLHTGSILCGQHCIMFVQVLLYHLVLCLLSWRLSTCLLLSAIMDKERRWIIKVGSNLMCLLMCFSFPMSQNALMSCFFMPALCRNQGFFQEKTGFQGAPVVAILSLCCDTWCLSPIGSHSE